MNFYEHEDRVKIIDHILSHEQNWDWFIELTEKTFEVELNSTSIIEAQNSFRDVRDVFFFLSKIHEITNQQLRITKNWLKELDLLAQFYLGVLELQVGMLSFSFSKIMYLLIFCGKIYGQIKGNKNYYYVEIFILRNLFTLDDLSLFIEEEDKIINILDNIGIDLTAERNTFHANINSILLPADEAFLEHHENEFRDANCFSYKRLMDDDVRVWEESELIKMAAVSIKDGKLVPEYQSEGSSYPNFDIWTSENLTHIRNFFNSDIVTFITESIEYILHQKVPSEHTINQHFTLLYEKCESIEENLSYHLSCSSLEFVILFISDDNTNRLINADSHKKYGEILRKLFDKNCYILLYKIKDRKALPNKDIVKKIGEHTKEHCNTVGNIDDMHSFFEYINDEHIRSYVEKTHFEVLAQKFDNIIAESPHNQVASIFLGYFLFLLRIKNNKDIIASQISLEIIRIRALWKDNYYSISTASLHEFTSDPISVHNTYSEDAIKSILAYPIHFAADMTKLRKDEMISRLQEISNHPLITVVNTILIDEDFPTYPVLKLDGKHPIDLLYKDQINQIVNEYAYKFLNSLSIQQYTQEMFKQIKDDMMLNVSIITDFKLLYDTVVSQNSEYNFLEYPRTLTLGHLTQLFPILENKIREFGEMFGIVPVCEDPDMCHRLKEPDIIINMILKQIQEMGGNISNTPDLFFIHFCMFGENGLNIRNDCIHGNDYLHDNRLSFAFKVTLISLYIIGWRIDMIEKNISQNSNNNTDSDKKTSD